MEKKGKGAKLQRGRHVPDHANAKAALTGSIPYIAFEGEMARHERTQKRLVVALVVTVVLLFVSNLAWLWLFSQYDIETEAVTLDANVGNASYIGDGSEGVITNGEGDSKEAPDDTQGR